MLRDYQKVLRKDVGEPGSVNLLLEDWTSGRTPRKRSFCRHAYAALSHRVLSARQHAREHRQRHFCRPRHHHSRRHPAPHPLAAHALSPAGGAATISSAPPLATQAYRHHRAGRSFAWRCSDAPTHAARGPGGFAQSQSSPQAKVRPRPRFTTRRPQLSSAASARVEILHRWQPTRTAWPVCAAPCNTRSGRALDGQRESQQRRCEQRK